MKVVKGCKGALLQLRQPRGWTKHGRHNMLHYVLRPVDLAPSLRFWPHRSSEITLLRRESGWLQYRVREVAKEEL